MKGGPRFYLAGFAMLLALAGCGRSFLQYGERASWRHEAEVTCLKSGAVKIGTGVVQIEPIEGPGMCGADFPLKVSALGEGSALVGYADDLRPPGAIPNASSAQMPRWPVNDPRYGAQAPVQPVQVQPVQVQPLQSQPVQAQPVQNGSMRWVPGPPGIAPAQSAVPAVRPDVTRAETYRPDTYRQDNYGQDNYRQDTYRQNNYRQEVYRPEAAAPAGRPMPINPPGAAPFHDDIPDDAVLPAGRTAPRAQPAYNAPVYQPPQQQRAVPALGPMRGPAATATIVPAAVSPPATLACPLVSALDRWVTDGVQPAALRWFGAQVVEIKQISAYSCREMVGSGTSHISEHAFGNALDVAAFTLANGRKVTVKDGWHGAPEEQGFLHDVQSAACQTFTTVLAPGYNIYHYDHIHVDLMRRETGNRPCRPEAISGEAAYAKARASYAGRQRGPAYTGSVAAQTPPAADAAEDGYVADDDRAAAVTSPIVVAPRAIRREIFPLEDRLSIH